MVAPSFANFTILTPDPFQKNGKFYVKVKNPSTGTERDVRWYTQEEYNKAYKGKEKPWKLGQNVFPNGLRDARGFKEGPILLIRNTKPKDKEWLHASPARYAVDFGWHIASTDKLPKDAPPHFKYLLLSWNEIKDHHDETNNTSIKREDIVKVIAEKVKKKDYITFIK